MILYSQLRNIEEHIDDVNKNNSVCYTKDDLPNLYRRLNNIKHEINNSYTLIKGVV